MFAYLVLAKDHPQPTSLIASWTETGQPLQAILWSAADLAWIYAPAIAARRLNDHEYQDTVDPVSREAAEQIAVAALNTELPDEETLLRMCQEGKTTGLIWGPSRN
jgi:hypothetical protein